MSEFDSPGSQAMREIAGRLRHHAATEDKPDKAFDLRQAAELLLHLEKLTRQLAKPIQAPLHSGRRPSAARATAEG
jgi:hypothetical protein